MCGVTDVAFHDGIRAFATVDSDSHLHFWVRRLKPRAIHCSLADVEVPESVLKDAVAPSFMTHVVFACAGWLAVGAELRPPAAGGAEAQGPGHVHRLPQNGRGGHGPARRQRKRGERATSTLTSYWAGYWCEPATSPHSHVCTPIIKALTPVPWLAYDRSLGHVRVCDGSPGSQVMVVPSHVWYPPHRRLQTGDFLVERIVEQVTGGGRAIRVLSDRQDHNVFGCGSSEISHTGICHRGHSPSQEVEQPAKRTHRPVWAHSQSALLSELAKPLTYFRLHTLLTGSAPCPQVACVG